MAPGRLADRRRPTGFHLRGGAHGARGVDAEEQQTVGGAQGLFVGTQQIEDVLGTPWRAGSAGLAEVTVIDL